MRNPLVSVCVPTYNGSPFLAQTLQSIAAQTFDDYEVIIVDDNSTDDSVALARQYAASDPRVKVFEPAQRAGSSARNANRCLAHARGEWIKLIFQDDVMAPHCLASLLDSTRDGHRFTLCWHGYHFEPEVDDKTREFYETMAALGTVLPGTYAAPAMFCEAVLAQWFKNFLGPPSSSFIHRECFARYGAFSSEMETLSDLEYWIRIGSNEGLAVATAYLVTFRVHEKSMSGRLRASSESLYRHELERVLLCVNLAFAPEYARMRAHLQARTPAVDPRRMLTKVARGARWIASDAKHRNENTFLWDRWVAFESAHPQVGTILRDFDSRVSWRGMTFRWTR